jgi:hypothetical protein
LKRVVKTWSTAQDSPDPHPSEYGPRLSFLGSPNL